MFGEILPEQLLGADQIARLQSTLAAVQRILRDSGQKNYTEQRTEHEPLSISLHQRTRRRLRQSGKPRSTHLTADGKPVERARSSEVELRRQLDSARIPGPHEGAESEPSATAAQ